MLNYAFLTSFLLFYDHNQAANDCDLEPVAYEFFTQAFILYEEEVVVITCMPFPSTRATHKEWPSVHVLEIKSVVGHIYLINLFINYIYTLFQDSKAQVTAMHLIIGALQRMNVLGVENRDTLTHKATGVIVLAYPAITVSFPCRFFPKPLLSPWLFFRLLPVFCKAFEETWSVQSSVRLLTSILGWWKGWHQGWGKVLYHFA